MRRRTISDKQRLLLAILDWARRRSFTSVADVMARFKLEKNVVLPLLREASVHEVIDPSGEFVGFGFIVEVADPEFDYDNDKMEDADPSEIIISFDAGSIHDSDRPLKLTMREAAGLLLVGENAMSVPGADPDGPLATGLEKLRAEFGSKLKMSVSAAQPEWFQELEDAIESRRRVRIRYESWSQSTVEDFVVDPIRLLRRAGFWFLAAVPDGKSEATVYRVTRIDDVKETGDRYSQEYDFDSAAFYANEFADAQQVVLSIPAEDLRIVERYPAVSIEVDEGTGTAEAVYNLRTPAVLSLMLMLLGPNTEIVNTDELPKDFVQAGQTAAQKILALYED